MILIWAIGYESWWTIYIGLLAYRIWNVNRLSRQWRATDHLSPILQTVIESGAIYSFTIIAALVTFAIESPGVYVVLDMASLFRNISPKLYSSQQFQISPIISIVYNMIIIRVGMASNHSILDDRSRGATNDPSPAPSPARTEDTSLSRHGVTPFNLDWLHETTGAHKMKPLTVEITQYRETDGDTAGDEELAEIKRGSQLSKDDLVHAV